jgi:DNA replication protein DnaC
MAPSAAPAREYLADLATVPLLIIDDLGMRKLPHRCRGSARGRDAPIRTRLDTPHLQRPVDDWGKLLGDTTAVTALLNRLLHHAHVLKCGPRSCRTKVHAGLRQESTP